MALLTPEMYAHLNAHRELFDEHQQEENANIERYFHDYTDEDGPGSVYVELCGDLGLTPIEPYGQPMVTWTLGLEDARQLWAYLHVNRPGGHQALHDSLQDAIREAAER
jgi:hypothetical protein